MLCAVRVTVWSSTEGGRITGARAEDVTEREVGASAGEGVATPGSKGR
jgi:hypothetical protein